MGTDRMGLKQSVHFHWLPRDLSSGILLEMPVLPFEDFSCRLVIVFLNVCPFLNSFLSFLCLFFNSYLYSLGMGFVSTYLILFH